MFDDSDEKVSDIEDDNGEKRKRDQKKGEDSEAESEPMSPIKKRRLENLKEFRRFLNKVTRRMPGDGRAAAEGG